MPDDDAGEVRDIRTGRYVGKTASLWETFCENAERVRARERCYAVAALSDVPSAVRERLAALDVPLVDDGALGGRGALLVSGEPAEWADGPPESVTRTGEAWRQ